MQSHKALCQHWVDIITLNQRCCNVVRVWKIAQINISVDTSLDDKIQVYEISGPIQIQCLRKQLATVHISRLGIHLSNLNDVIYIYWRYFLFKTAWSASLKREYNIEFRCKKNYWTDTEETSKLLNNSLQTAVTLCTFLFYLVHRFPLIIMTSLLFSE